MQKMIIKAFSVVCFFFVSQLIFSQSIFDVGVLPPETPLDEVLQLSWVQDSTTKQYGEGKDYTIYAYYVPYEGKTYDACIFEFYDGLLYRGLMAKIYESEEEVMNEMEAVRNAIGAECKDFNTGDELVKKSCMFTDGHENMLIASAATNGKQWALRLQYGSNELYERKENEERKKREEEYVPSDYPQIELAN